MFAKSTVTQSMIDAVNKVLEKETVLGEMLAEDEIDTTGKEVVSEVSPPGFEGTVKAMKKHKDITNPFALAWSMKNKGYKSHKKDDGTAKNEETVEEGMVDALKKGVKAVGKALGGPDDEGHKKDLQRKMGIPQTGKPSMAKQNEEVEQIDEISKASLHSYATAAHTKYDTLRNKSDSASTEKKSKLAQGIKTANQKMNPPVQHKPEPKVDMSSPSAYYKSKGSGSYVGDSVEVNGTPLEEKSTLKGNQKKIDKNHNGKIDGQDFKILRGQKKANEEITTDTLVGQMKGGKSNAFKSFKSTLKGDIDKTPAAKEGKPTAQHKVVKAEEVQQEGWDDMVKDTKERMGSGPKPSGGSGVKKGSRYGGSKQKDEPEETEKKTVKENKGPESDTVPFVRNDSAPISVARDTAQRAMKRIKTEMMGKIAN